MGKPKGKTTAYSYFVQKQKEIFQSDNPGAKIVFGDFMKECGAKWRELEDSDKTPFNNKAKADAVRYAREMDDYEPDEVSTKKKKRKKVKIILKNDLEKCFLKTILKNVFKK